MTTILGLELKDGWKIADTWVKNGLTWLDEIQAFYRERAEIEKEYGTKLQALAKKYYEKKNKKSASLSVGDTPSITPGSLENASITTWTHIINDTEAVAKERLGLGEEFKMQIAEPLKSLNYKFEDFRVRSENHNKKLVEEREKTYSELRHSQKKYYEACNLVEKERQKSAGGGGQGKHSKALAVNMADMANMKNSYLISTQAANAHKSKHYYIDIPDLLNTLQDINEIRVQKLNAIWTRAAELEKACILRQGLHLEHALSATSKNKPELDTNMFAQHNRTNWQEPPNFVFEVCPIWHDTPELVTDSTAQVFLQNMVAKNRQELNNLKVQVSTKKREVDGLTQSKTACMQDSRLGAVEEILHNLLNTKLELSSLENRQYILESEMKTITAVTGDIDVGLSPHDFKSASFAIPTTCDFCSSTIWGMSRKGYKCAACDYHCHKNCQMKVPVNCTGVKGEKKSASTIGVPQNDGEDSLSRTATVDSRMNGSKSARTKPNFDESSEGENSDNEDLHRNDAGNVASAPTPGSAKPAVRRSVLMAPPPSGGYKLNPNVIGSGPAVNSTKVNYAYDATGSGEISISEGSLVVVLEGDNDGSGWITVRSSNGQEGLVPASYVANPHPTISSPQPSSPVPTTRPAMVGTRSSSIASLSSLQRPVGGNGTGSIRRQGPPVAAKRGGKKLKQVRALYDYSAEEPGELSISEGSIVLVLKEDTGDGWTEGELGGLSGIFPTSYVENC